MYEERQDRPLPGVEKMISSEYDYYLRRVNKYNLFLPGKSSAKQNEIIEFDAKYIVSSVVSPIISALGSCTNRYNFANSRFLIKKIQRKILPNYNN